MNHQHQHQHPHQPRRIFTSRLKRKEREQSFCAGKPSPLAPAPPLSQQIRRGMRKTTSKGSKGGGREQEAMSSNQLLAGYMAYEFLTKGTVLGQIFDAAGAEAIPGRVKSKDFVEEERKRTMVKDGGGDGNLKRKKQNERYSDVACLLIRAKGGGGGGGAHIPHIVNPKQLARWVQM